jgi:uncharacterized protein (TIGR02300 family)
MRKSAEKSNAAVSLGTKRTCPQCGTKFYDFNKDVLVCPKCEAKVDPDSTKVYKAPAEAKKPKAKEGPEAALLESEDIVVEGGDEAFESVEDLDDDEEEIVEDLDVDGEESGDF